jgi:hypothetical protein
MIPDLLNYRVSFLNPMLKLIVPFIFLYGAYCFYRARQEYGNELKTLMTVLAITGVVGFLATLFRYFGDIVSLWKWGESVGFFAFGAACVYASWYAAGPLTTFVRKLLQRG